jgi:uncharacterized protein YndB with AHSA1/START domain
MKRHAIDARIKALGLAIAAICLLAAGPAAAEVRESSDSGFVVQLGIDVPASPADTWTALLTPARWWNAEHTFSQNSANLSLDPRAGGCFCEVLPNKQSPNAAPRGSVEHMRVIYLERPRALRMAGALGPLQAMAGTGTLTVILKPHDSGTRILWEYGYSGHIRGDARAMATMTDQMLADQLLRLGGQLGATKAKAEKAPEAATQPAESDDDAFAREMLGGLDSDEPVAAGDQPVIKPEYESLPASRDPGFIGR